MREEVFKTIRVYRIPCRGANSLVFNAKRTQVTQGYDF